MACMERPTPPRSRTLPPPDSPPGQSGVALLIVLVVLFIVAVLMVDISLTASTARRSASNASNDFLMDAAIEGRFQICAAQILYDGKENKTDSVNDRWVKEEFADPAEPGTGEDAFEPPPGGEDDEPSNVLGDTAGVTITRTIEDEERKFNLNLLLHSDKARREEARERLAILIDRFRENTPLDISRTKAEQLVEAVVKYLDRPAPGEGERGKIPLPGKPWRLLTPDELLNVEGFTVDDAGYGATEILYTTRVMEDVLAWEEDPENAEKPEEFPGLLRYVTLWSGSAWGTDKQGKPVVEPDSWLKININTAEPPVLATLFRLDQDQDNERGLVAKIREFREGAAEDAEPATGDTEAETTPDKQVFEGDEQIKKVDGLAEALGDPKRAYPGVAAFSGNTFSVDLYAKIQLESQEEPARKQVRFIIRRTADSKGYTTLLREERDDPRFEDEPKKEGEEE